MIGQNIVCFAKDWNEDPTSNNHVMRLLAKRNQVLWLNSIAMRVPTFTSGSDLRKLGRKLRSLPRGAESIAGGMRVFTPMVLPFPHSPVANWINQAVLRGTLSLLRAQRRMSPFQLWTFLPTAAPYVGALGEELAVYYCTDEWSQFSYLDGARIAAQERRLCERADIVFTTAGTLLDRKKIYNSETHLASHGVDWAHFASSLDDSTPLAPEMEVLPAGPVIGFVGLIQGWVDLPLIDFLAERRPHWQIVLIGKAAVDISGLRRRKNVHLLGRKPYAELPRYCRGFTVGIIPFVLNELTRNVNPIKLREYFSAGLPVVSSDIPEVARYANERDCFVASGHADFLAAIERAIHLDDHDARRARSDGMKAESWEHKAAALGQHIIRIKRKKGLT